VSWTQVIVLALVQGVTEFLPISSSAHLILTSRLLGLPDQGLGFDVAIHLGTLAAVVWYFRSELGGLVAACAPGRHGAETQQSRQLAWHIGIATLPVLVAGLMFADLVEGPLRDVRIITATTIFFGLVLWWADRGPARTAEVPLNWRLALWIGLAQALALLPGTSRSGITITAALLLGLSRSSASRFSFLLAIPTISMAGGYGILQLVLHHQLQFLPSYMVAIAISALSGYACIALFLRWINRLGMTPFVIYRLLLGGALALWVL